MELRRSGFGMPGQARSARPRRRRLAGNLTRVAIAPDARLMAIADAAGQVTLWDLAARSQLGGPVPVSDDRIYGLAFVPNRGCGGGAPRQPDRRWVTWIVSLCAPSVGALKCMMDGRDGAPHADELD